MSKSIKLEDDNYWDSTGIVHNKELLSKILFGRTVYKDVSISSETKEFTIYGTVNMVITHHSSHGSSGGIYFLFRGRASGNKIVSVVSSSHATLSYSNEKLTITADSWGVHVNIIQLV